MTNILEVENLNKSYKTFHLDNVSFKVPTGYIMGFIGPNGSGKTTTIKSILNAINIDAGKITFFNDTNMIDRSLINNEIGVVTDNQLFVKDWTINDVEKAVSMFYSKWSSQLFIEYLTRFNLDRTKKVKELSRGMNVKLMLAVALSHNAKLLILDEPTSGLDPVARDELCDILSEYVSDETRSVLFSTHITSDLEKIADYITFILNGKIIYSGLKEDLLERYCLVKGGLEDLSEDLKKYIIGLRQYANGFEGMIDVKYSDFLSKAILTEKITLEEIIVFMNKGANHE